MKFNQVNRNGVRRMIAVIVFGMIPFSSYAQQNSDPSFANAIPQQQQAGVMGQTSNQMQSQASVSEEAARANLGPQSVSLQTALESALAKVEGLKTQLSSIPSGPKDSMDQIKNYTGNIKSDLKTAKSSADKMESQLSSYPTIAGSDQAKLLENSVSNLQEFNKGWTSRNSDDKYWMNREQALNDVNKMAQQLTNTIGQAKLFNSKQLGVG